MQSVFVIITKIIASKSYLCKEVFCNKFGRDGSFLFKGLISRNHKNHEKHDNHEMKGFENNPWSNPPPFGAPTESTALLS